MNLYQHKKGGLYRIIHDDKPREGIEYALDVSKLDGVCSERKLVVYENSVGEVFCRDFEEFHGHDENGIKRFVAINTVSDIKQTSSQSLPTSLRDQIRKTSEDIDKLAEFEQGEEGTFLTKQSVSDISKAIAKLSNILVGGTK